MRDLAWSFLERIFPRAASAIITLILAHFVDPGVVGVYAWAVLGLTLVQAVTDGAVRQIAVVALLTRDGQRFLRSYSRWSGLLGLVALIIMMILLLILLPSPLRSYAWWLAPLCLVPSVQAARVWSVAQLQTAGRWALLARGQLISAAGSFAVSLPVLVATRSLLACALQVLVTEAIFTATTRRWAGKSTTAPHHDTGFESDSSSVRREFRHLVLYSLFGWLQGQSDRLLLAWFTTTSRLGLYSLAWSMSRSVGDSVSFSTANVLRPKLAGHIGAPPSDVRRAAEPVLLRAVGLSSLVVLATGAGSQIVFPYVLGPQWDPAIQIVPIMALSALPTLLAWSLTSVLIAARRLRWAAPIKAVGIVLSLPIAWAASIDFELAAWFLVGREVVVLALTIIASGRYSPVRSLAAGAGFFTVLALAAVINTAW